MTLLQRKPAPIDEMERQVRSLVAHLDDEPARDGLEDTPRRVAKALLELTAGRHEDPAVILARTFEEAYDGPVVVQAIPFWSLCEHHLLPFHGTVSIAYVPDGRVVGLSKLARLVQCFARRLQMQERLTRQIAGAVRLHLGAVGVAVRVEAEHACMSMRGVRSAGRTVTEARHGSFAGEERAVADRLLDGRA